MGDDAVGFDELTCLYAFTCLLTVKYYEEKYLCERRRGGPFIAKKNLEKSVRSPFPSITFGGLPSNYMRNLSWNVESGDLKKDVRHEDYTKVTSHHSKHGSRHDSIRFDALLCLCAYQRLHNQILKDILHTIGGGGKISNRLARARDKGMVRFVPISLNRLERLGACHGGMDARHGGIDARHGGMDARHGGMDACHGGMDACHGGVYACHGGMDACHGGMGCTPRRYGCMPRRYGCVPRRCGCMPRRYGMHATAV